MSRIFRYITVAAAISSLMLHSCSERPDSPEIEGQDSAAVMLNLMITSQAGTYGTRAGGHDLEAALDPENYIDILNSDYRILIFDGKGRFLQNFDATERKISATTSSDKYTVALSGPLTVSTGEIQVLVLTNWKSFDSAAQYPVMAAGDALSPLYTDAAQHLFTMPVATGNTSWQPVVSTAGIPMFGVSAITPLSAAGDPADTDVVDGKKVEGKVLDIGEIKLLRALSKIEVMGAVSLPTNLSVAAVSLSAYNTVGRFIPDITANPDWNILETQVKTPTLPADAVRSPHELRFFQVPGTGTWRAYVPEMDLTANRPDLTITITNSISGATVPFDIALDDPAKPGTLASLLRNHIYRYIISSVEMESDITAILDVVPYDETKLEPGFGKDNDELEADGQPYDEKELNPKFGE